MGQYFDDIHATYETELRGLLPMIADSEEVAAARKEPGYEGYMALGKALSAQLRYRESAEAFSKAVSERPDDLTAHRLLAGKLLSSLQAKKAYHEFEICRSLGGEPLDIAYRQGLCCWYLRDYAGAMRHFELAFPLADDEMGIAVIYWHTLSAFRCGKEMILLKDYHPGMCVGHHFAYEKAVAVWAGAVSIEEALSALEKETEDLHFGITAYGISLYLEYLQQDREAARLMDTHLSRDSFWISFAFLAAWNDRYGG